MGKAGEIIKIIPANDGELYMTSGGRRCRIASFSGRVEIEERQAQVAILGTMQKGAKRIYASFIVCGDMDFQKGFGFDAVHGGRVFEAQAGVCGERLAFAGLRFEDSDPLRNELIFEIPDLELVQELLSSGWA